ncbi:MAG: SH3 domain-containing protein [Acutalibacteraceae bacterium]|nr:SH3 domain-containing protein [Acutalibacteraceae bacterium]
MESQTKPTHKHLTKKPLFRWLIAVMCMLALLLTSVPLVSLQAAASTPVYVKTETAVNLRTGAGTQYSTLQVLKKDTTVTLLDRSNTDWYKVRLGDGTTGYCYANNMDVLNDCKSTDYLNFRTGPSTDYSIIRTLVPGTRLNIICFSGGLWLKAVAPDGVVGYVCTDYV